MGKLTLPVSLADVCQEFGISTFTTTSLKTKLTPDTLTGGLWDADTLPGFIPSNTKTSSGVLISASNYKTLSNFVGCNYVCGSMVLRVSAASFSTTAALFATVENQSGYICGHITPTITNGVTSIYSRWQSRIGDYLYNNATCSVQILTSYTAGTYKCAGFQLIASNNVYSDGVFKIESTRSFAPDLTDSYANWITRGTSLAVNGVLYNGYYYVSIFVRNRTA